MKNIKWKMENPPSLPWFSWNSPCEAVAVFTRSDECFDHLRLLEIAAKLVQLVEPELVAGKSGGKTAFLTPS
jgi:hypothetical protein